MAGLLSLSGGAFACPLALHDARRLILVTVPTMTSITAKVGLYARDSAELPWRLVDPAEPAVLGRSGLGWGVNFVDLARAGEPKKAEGDMRTPAGIYLVGAPFGFAPSGLQRYIQIRKGETVCVDDPSSPAYNTIASRASVGPKTHFEAMGGVELYRRGVVIDYPTSVAATGSCIFIHVWRSNRKGTAGCVALPEEKVSAIQNFSEPGAVIAIAPEAALPRFGGCLPDIESTSVQWR
jgi:L,D-peptidoglycan transpeptidase YkuD (ErfK/YbiS/YcfS/YnhG family)